MSTREDKEDDVGIGDGDDAIGGVHKEGEEKYQVDSKNVISAKTTYMQ